MKTWREIVKKTVQSKDARVIPHHIIFFPMLEKLLRERLGADDLDAAVGNAVHWVGADESMTPAGDGRQEDLFGVVWQTNSCNRGCVVRSPLMEPDMRLARIPEYNYATIFARLPAELERTRDYYNILWVGDLFERAQMMRGMEECLTDFYLNPGFLHELFDALADLIVKTICAARSLDAPAVFLSDDYGTQNGLFISRALWMEFIRPHLCRIVETAHNCGKAFFLHSDGNIGELMPDLIELGVDAIHPVQPETMDFRLLKRQYGKDICFYGGIGTQQTLRFGRPEDVRKEVAELKRCPDGIGFILAPTLQLMEDIPVENVLALIEAVGGD